jgi:hypothetical protein
MAGSIKLYGPSGYTELAADVNADDNVLTLPSTGTTLATDVDLATKLNIAGGKILQIVRATDSTNRTTTSTSFVDASISVTITPQKNDSVILLVWSLRVQASTNGYIQCRIADSSNNAISGGNEGTFGASNASGSQAHITMIAYATPSTTNAITYKGRFVSDNGGTVSIFNQFSIGQLYAIEVSA